MTTRNPKHPVHGANSESDQILTTGKRRIRLDRPAGGAVRPVHGTIEAPIVVVGATGTIGRAVVRALVATGQPVVAVSPRPERLSELQQDLPETAVTPVVGQVRDEADAARLARTLRALARPVAGVVIAFPHGKAVAPERARGRLLDQATEELADCLAQTVIVQHALARHLMPLLVESGRNAHYVIVGGPGSETPWAGYGQRSVAMAATRMLARVLHDEARTAGVRVQLLSIDAPVRGEEPAEHECPEWPAASDVARRVAQLLDRTSTDESADAVVACSRSRAATSIGHSFASTYPDVPAFFDSLRNSTKGNPLV